MRWEQCCETDGCTKPAHHGALCAACFRAATPARRATELLAAAPAPVTPADGYVDDEGVAWLRDLWAAA
jgi:hypothetical protein